MEDQLLKLNLGGGPKRIPGYKNVDAMDWDGVTDVIHDLTKYPWPFKMDTVDEIIAMEFLEHISFKESTTILSECFRILKVGGILHLQVPDCGKAMQYYVNNEICDCVPHKAPDWNSYKSDPNCFKCGGRGKIHPNRWLFSFTGAQKHDYDIHRNVFTKERMTSDLQRAGFIDFTFSENPYKLIADVIKR